MFINGLKGGFFLPQIVSASSFALAERPALDSYAMAMSSQGGGFGGIGALQFTPVLNPDFIAGMKSSFNSAMAWCNFPMAYQAALGQNGASSVEQGARNYFGNIDYNLDGIQIHLDGERSEKYVPINPKKAKKKESEEPKPAEPEPPKEEPKKKKKASPPKPKAPPANTDPGSF